MLLGGSDVEIIVQTDTKYLEYGQLTALVDDPLVNGVWAGDVDHLAEDDAVIHLLVHIAPGLIQRQEVLHVLVVLQVVVDPLAEGGLLLVEDHVRGPHVS